MAVYRKLKKKKEEEEPKKKSIIITLVRCGYEEAVETSLNNF